MTIKNFDGVTVRPATQEEISKTMTDESKVVMGIVEKVKLLRPSDDLNISSIVFESNEFLEKQDIINYKEYVKRAMAYLRKMDQNWQLPAMNGKVSYMNQIHYTEQQREDKKWKLIMIRLK